MKDSIDTSNKTAAKPETGKAQGSIGGAGLTQDRRHQLATGHIPEAEMNVHDRPTTNLGSRTYEGGRSLE